MELKGIYSLYCFNQILKSATNRSTENFTLSYYSKDFKEYYFGYKFKVEASQKEDIWLNVGVWFDRENPVITIEVWKNEGWGKPFYEIIEKGKSHIENYAGHPYLENSEYYYFEGTEKFYNEFENAIDAEAQEEFFCKFVDEVVNFYVKS